MLIQPDRYHPRARLPSLNPSRNSCLRFESSSHRSDNSTPHYRSSHIIISTSHRNSDFNHDLVIKYRSCSKAKTIITRKVEELHNKILNINEIQLKYGIKFHNRDLKKLSVKELEEKALAAYNTRIRSLAYNKLASWWKKLYIKKKIHKDKDLTETAAILVQKNWKAYLRRKNGRSTRKQIIRKEHNAALVIQSRVRGHLARKMYQLQIKQRLMNLHFSYFFKIKQKLLGDSVKIISNAWLKYKERQELRAQRKEKAAAKKEIYTILSRDNTNSPVSPKIKNLLIKRIITENTLKSRSEPDSPLINLARLRSETVDYVGITLIYVDPIY